MAAALIDSFCSQASSCTYSFSQSQFDQILLTLFDPCGEIPFAYAILLSTDTHVGDSEPDMKGSHWP